MTNRQVFRVGLVLMGAVATTAWADDIPVVGTKLIIVDKTVASSSAKAVFVAKDANISKGADTDTSTVFAELGVSYDGNSGSFGMPGGLGWIVNKDTVAKYLNNAAPSGGGVKVAVLKPGALIKVVGKSLGDSAIDISAPPTGDVFVTHMISNGGFVGRHCTRFGSCAHKVIAGGTGYKLVCTGDSTGDPTCSGAPPPVCCDLTSVGTVCTFAPSALTCGAAGGTPGPEGSVCDSVTGACAVAASPGACCENILTPFGSLCVGGPVLAPDAEVCAGGYSASAVCSPGGTCD